MCGSNGGSNFLESQSFNCSRNVLKMKDGYGCPATAFSGPSMPGTRRGNPQRAGTQHHRTVVDHPGDTPRKNSLEFPKLAGDPPIDDRFQIVSPRAAIKINKHKCIFS